MQFLQFQWHQLQFLQFQCQIVATHFSSFCSHWLLLFLLANTVQQQEADLEPSSWKQQSTIWKKHKNKHNMKKNTNKHILSRLRSRENAVSRSLSVPKYLAPLASIFATLLNPFWLSIFLVLALLTTPTFFKPCLESTLFRSACLSFCKRRTHGKFKWHFWPLWLICKRWDWSCICSFEFCYRIIFMQIWMHV